MINIKTNFFYIVDKLAMFFAKISFVFYTSKESKCAKILSKTYKIISIEDLTGTLSYKCYRKSFLGWSAIDRHRAPFRSLADAEEYIRNTIQAELRKAEYNKETCLERKAITFIIGDI